MLLKYYAIEVYSKFLELLSTLEIHFWVMNNFFINNLINFDYRSLLNNNLTNFIINIHEQKIIKFKTRYK